MDTTSLLNKAARLQQSGHSADALKLYMKVLRKCPDNSSVLNTVASIHQSNGATDKALEYYQKTLRHTPDDITALGNSGLIHQQHGNLEQAKTFYSKILQHSPDNLPAMMNLIMVVLDSGQREAAIRLADRAIELNPGIAQAYTLKGNAYYALGRFEHAIIQHKLALDLQPDLTASTAGLINSLIKTGDRDTARQVLSTCKEQEDTNILLARCQLAKDDERETLADSITGITEKGQLNRQQNIQLHFAAGTLYDRCGNFDRAFHHFQAGNDLVGKQFDPTADDRLIEQIVSCHQVIPPASVGTDNSAGDGLIFLVGFPRSGTSLLEQILGEHPDVHPMGERPDIPRLCEEIDDTLTYPQSLKVLTVEQVDHFRTAYLDSTSELVSSCRYITDKLPHNFLYIGVIKHVFPGCKIVHCIRDKFDTCLSNYMQLFSSSLAYAYEQKNIAHHYNNYSRIMQYWSDSGIELIDIGYEDIVTDPRQTLTRLLDALHLDFDERCLDFHRSTRITRTASVDQVRSPLYTSSINRWQLYRDHLQPLLTALDGPIHI